MKIIPAIDIRGGKVVRLFQGNAELQTVYPGTPLEMAQRWASYGAAMIHVVDLDGALKGELVNLETVREIASTVKTKVELGGGIRDIETIERVLGAGIDRVVIGTKALDDQFLKALGKPLREKVVVGIDAREGFVHTKGWVLKTKMKALDLARHIEDAGITTINYTDISKDGTLEGPNIDSLRELLNKTGLTIVASGGISNIDDVKRLKLLEKDGLAGVIIGKALYEGAIDLTEAIKVATG